MMRGLLVLALALVTSGLQEIRSLKDVGESSEVSSEADKQALRLKLRLQADAQERERAAAAHNREMVEETAKLVEEKTSMEVQKAITAIKAAKEEAAKKKKHEENQRALARAQAKAIEISANQKYHR